jgi:TonB-like protein
MSMIRCFGRIFPLLVVSSLATGPIHAQESASSSPAQTTVTATYPNTKEGLQQLLQDMRAAAKGGNQAKLAAFLKDMEIPDCDAWLHKMYESDKADSWMSLCDAKTLASNKKSMQQRFAQFGAEDGQILVRKVNDEPQPGKGMEWGWLQAIKAPLDIYFADWKRGTEPKDAKGEPIGYFMFIDGGFRWESSIQFIKPRITSAKFVPTKLIKKVNPIYPPAAASQHPSGIVRVYYVIGADGAVYNVHAISGEGLSEDLSLRKAAEEAVIQWRYQPATMDGKPILTNAVTVDIAFSPAS